jgi:hypothetical protein
MKNEKTTTFFFEVHITPLNAKGDSTCGIKVRYMRSRKLKTWACECKGNNDQTCECGVEKRKMAPP